jgi:hypothetical protein
VTGLEERLSLSSTGTVLTYVRYSGRTDLTDPKSSVDLWLPCWQMTVHESYLLISTVSLPRGSQNELTSLAIQEFSKRPSSSTTASKSNPHHVTTPTDLTLAQCLAISDVVISAVPSQAYKVPTKDLKDGCVCVNVAGEKNFEADVRERVSCFLNPSWE